MKMINKGDGLKRSGISYEVVCADSQVFIIAPIIGGRTNWGLLEGYSNESNILSLAEMGFVLEGEDKADV